MRLRTALPTFFTIALAGLVGLVVAPSPSWAQSPAQKLVAPAAAGQQALAVSASDAGITAKVCPSDAGCSAEGGAKIELPEAALSLAKRGAKIEAKGLVGGRRVVRVDLGEATGARYVVLLAAPLSGKGDAPLTIWSDFVGRTKGEDGEARVGSVVEEKLDKGLRIVVGEEREDVSICGRRALVSGKEIDPDTLTLKRGASVQSLSAEERAAATKIKATPISDAKPRPIVPLLRAQSASSAVGKAISTLTDGDPETSWSEAKAGAGRGEFVLFSSSSDVPVLALEMTVRPPKADVPEGASPKRVYVATTGSLFEVELPEDAWRKAGARYEVKFPLEVKSSCMALVLDEAYAPASAADARVTIAEVTARTAFDESSIDALVGALAGGEARAQAAAALLEKTGKQGVQAIVANYDKLDDAGKRLAEGVINAAPCGDQVPFYAKIMGDRLSAPKPARSRRGEFDQALEQAKDRLRRCGRASAEALAGFVKTGEGRLKLEAAAEIALIAPADAVPVLVDALSTKDDAERYELRLSLAHAAKNDRAKNALASELEKGQFSGRSEVVRIDLLRALGSHIAAVPGGKEAFASLATKDASFRARYLLQGPAAELAREGDASAQAFLVESMRKDPDAHVRQRAAEVAERTASVLPSLLEAADDPEVRVREAAVKALGTRGREAAAPPADVVTVLSRRLAKDPFTFVRSQAARALGEMAGTKASDAALASALTDGSPEVRARALDALGEHGAAEYKAPIRRIAENDGELPEVRARAILALAAMCDTSLVESWTKLAQRVAYAIDEGERTVGAAAIAALGDIKPKDLKKRLEILLDPKAPRQYREMARAALEATPKCK